MTPTSHRLMARAGYGAVMAGALVWAACSTTQIRADREWAALWRQNPTLLLGDAGRETANPGYHLARAEVLLDRAFPPAYADARGHLEQTLQGEPRSAVAWMRLAETGLFRGNNEAAEIALKRSDELDPAWPAQRAASIRHWGLMGREERSFETAQLLVRLDPASRRRALAELALLGVAPEAAFERLGLATLEGGAGAQLLADFREAYGRGVLRALAPAMPPGWWEEPGFRREALAQSIAPFRWELASVLWAWELGRDATWDTPPHDVAFGSWDPPIDWNETDLPLGWLRPARNPLAVVGVSEATAAVRFDPRIQRPWRWPFFRTLTPPGTGVRIAFDIRSDPANRSEARVDADGPGGSSGFALSTSDSEWVECEVVVPASETGGTITLILTRQRRGFASVDEQPTISVRNLRIAPLDDPPARLRARAMGDAAP